MAGKLIASAVLLSWAVASAASDESQTEERLGKMWWWRATQPPTVSIVLPPSRNPTRSPTWKPPTQYPSVSPTEHPATSPPTVSVVLPPTHNPTKMWQWPSTRPPTQSAVLPPTPKPRTCGGGETAFGKGAGAICFSDYGISRWGWTHHVVGMGVGQTLSFSMYAGAGQCDTRKGFLAGSVDVTRLPDNLFLLQVSNAADAALGAFHVNIGSRPLAQDKKGQDTVAPGQFNCAFSGSSAICQADPSVCPGCDFWLILHSEAQSCT